VNKFINEVKQYKIGSPLDPSTYLGPLARPQQIEVIRSQIEDAVSKGAKVGSGGRSLKINNKGYYFEPTVLLNVNHTMKITKEESFGPIIGLQSVKNDMEAIHLMNDSEYGLTSAIFTSSKQRAFSVLTEMNSGSVYWNCCDRVSPQLPWSGRKGSGIGSTLSTEGIKTFLQPKSWHLRFPSKY